MNGTPRLRSAYPLTPQTGHDRRRANASPSTSAPLPNGTNKLHSISSLQKGEPADTAPDEPIISPELITPATQRLCVVLVYIGLLIWRFRDFWILIQDDTESLWQFLKWLLIDTAFIYGVPALKIPWLEWSSTTTTLLFSLHAIFNGILMFKILPPVSFWFASLFKLFSNAELALSETKVNPSRLLDTANMLSGKQVIHILPEGSAVMNPYHEPFCIGPENKHITIPIQINQTNPKLIDLLRVDLEGSYNETIRIGASELKRLRKTAVNEQRPKDGSGPLMLRYLSKKTGRYTLEKVVDETGLEVRPRFSELLVVPCPIAHVKSSSGRKCKDDLSDVSFEITGTPPLTLRYNKTTEGSLIEHKSLQSIQPDGFASPLLRQESTLSPLAQSGKVDISWARPCSMSIPVNEKMSRPGEWIYSVDSVEDALGNIVSYEKQFDEDGKAKSKHQDLQQSVFVQDRPRVSFGCDTQRPLKVAKGRTIALPLRFATVGKGHPRDSTYSVEYRFTPQESLLENGEHNPETQQLLDVNLKSPWQRVEVARSGLYTLKSVKAGWCDGEVDEPASCILEHPPEPEVSITAESITDKCDRMPIGLRADFDFIGTPPFTLDYVIESKGKPSEFKQTKSENRRYQLELKPRNAGHYTYKFASLTDQYYQARRISEILEVDVKPSANAELMLDGTAKRPRLCLGDQAEFSVRFTGESPWSLEYEVVHGGKKTKSKIDNISENEYTFRTAKLQSGGDYSLVLVSVSDSRNCPESLKEEVKFHVRHQRPKAGFGTIEGQRTAQAVEDAALALPIRLTGEKPWHVEVKNIDDQHSPPKVHLFENPNAEIHVNRQGTYQINGVRDVICAGQVEEGANQFVVSWRDRPHLRISESPTLKKADDSRFRKEDVCEGDEDYLDIAFTGTPPFQVEYDMQANPERGQKYSRSKSLDTMIGVTTIPLDTSNAGDYQYNFVKLSDKYYVHDRKRSSPVVVYQRVNSRPTARFPNPGRTYSFCKVDGGGEERIPIAFTGVPPFYIEIEIKYSGSQKTDILTHSRIDSHSWSFPIPRDHPYLKQGTSHLTIRKVRDSRGCQSKLPEGANAAPQPRVQISVHDPPTITPLETRQDFCVGEKPSFRLSGAPPFNIYYTFDGRERKAVSYDTIFSRWAELPGNFTITSLSDAASDCKAPVSVTKTIHAVPQAHIAKGKQAIIDIHEGGTAELIFELSGEPPFEFTYTRSSLPGKGKKSVVLETRTETTTEHMFKVQASEEGEYEIISVRDRWCAASKASGKDKGKAQKLLMQ